MRRASQLAIVLPILAAGCLRSPEDGRPRAGGPGGDARNVPAAGVRPPSKLDETKDLARFRPRESPTP